MVLRNINLNLLPILQALLREQSVSGAAVALGLTQPAVSAALARLRAVLHDPLLVKVGRRMELTSRARDLIAAVEHACDALNQVWSGQAFDPATTQRNFVIASADHGPLLIAPPLIERIIRDAPNVSLHFIDFTLDQLNRGQDRRVEFLMAPRGIFDSIDHEDLHILPITSGEDFVTVIGPNHRLAGKPDITAADLASEPCMLFHPGAARAHELSELVAGFDPSQHIVARFAQFTILPVMASLTDAVAIVPQRIADQLSKILNFRAVGRCDTARTTDICLAWSPVYDADPAHKWLRDLIKEVMA